MLDVSPVVAHLLYALAWASFGVVHSLLARDFVRDNARPEFRPYYRLSYNVLSGVHFAGILFLEIIGLPKVAPFAWPEPMLWALYAVQIFGWGLLVYAVSRYDLGRFTGFREATGAMAVAEARRRKGMRPTDPAPDLPEERPEPLVTDGIHRYVRHPLYTGLLLILWARVFNEYQLATAVWGSLYIVIGTHFEERSLVRQYGEAYARYRQLVPAYFPWKGRAFGGE